jgi:SNF2 family DNA or RNA helicase
MKTLDDLGADQREAIDFILEGQDSLLAADVGTGKTVISMTAGMEAIRTQRVNRWLVLGPSLVCRDTWVNEPAEWEHLRQARVVNIAGMPPQKRHERIVLERSDFVCCNYENLPWLVDGGYLDAFDGLICDEIDKLKSVSSNRFKAFRNHVKQFGMRVGLTGTLVPNELTELWGQVYTIDGGESFGRSFYKWRREHFYPTDYQQYNWRILPGHREKLIQAIADITFRLPARGLPPVEMMPPKMLTMPEQTMATYRELEREYYMELKDEYEDEELIVDAVSEAVLGGKLQQICAGFSYTYKPGERPGKKRADGSIVRPVPVWHSYDRLQWLDELLTGDLRGQQVLIFFHFQEELEQLKQRYPAMAVLKDARDPTGMLRAWNAGEIPHLALHPASAGHGLNLQKGGAHHIAFLTMPWSGGMMKQVTGRLARRGQAAEKVYVHTALFRDTIDEEVFERVTSRLNHMEDFLDELYKATSLA